MVDAETKPGKVQVASLPPGDSGRGLARVPLSLMREMGLNDGDIIEICGKRATPAVAVRPYPDDEGLDIIRIDGLQRHNAQVGAGDFVTIAKTSSVAAKSVVLAPAQPHVRLQGSSAALQRSFANRPMKMGDLVATAGQQRVNQEMPEQLRRLLNAPAFALQEIRLKVVSTKPDGIVHIDANTEVSLLPVGDAATPDPRSAVTYDDLGGMSGTIDGLREMVELPLRHPELFQRLGVDPPKGVLLHGPPGTGKTMLARAVANESDAKFFHIAGPEVMGSGYGESEKKLRQLFEEAAKEAPSIIFIDEIDSIAPKRDRVAGEAEKRLVAQLLTLMDGVEPRQNTVIIAATNRPEAIDEALRRPGRFDREIVIGVPDENGRREIFGIHTRGMPLGEDVDLDALSKRTHGFVGADVAALTREAALEAVRRIMPKLNLEDDTIPAEVLDNLSVNLDDFQEALKRVQPSAMREVMVSIPQTTWSDIGGLDDARDKLREGIELPLTHPDAFKRLGIRPAKGFMLYGPPGTGKTLLAKATARESHANFISVKSSDMLSKWYGESEQQIARLFARARQVAPTIIFIDEIDSLVPARGGGHGEPQVTERVVNTILSEMDGLEDLNNVVLIGATNRPNLVDPALLRPGRFDELIYVGPPTYEGRLRILQIHTQNMPLADDVDLEEWAKKTERFTGADLEDLTRRAGLIALRRNDEEPKVTRADFEAALGDTGASVTEKMIEEYAKIQANLKSDAVRPTAGIGFHIPSVDGER
ncbi:CDC48 family AAA ATPase [Sphingomicrobium marinum]|uniref:CDC48 family AAA ATPase n=1 Tax=Sphingomicrobium marinum TaxID=1227950 RepID=UPI00223FE3B6|nr:CDC48 family AAA ATPase [Sphingomicrobium marinum]